MSCRYLWDLTHFHYHYQVLSHNLISIQDSEVCLIHHQLLPQLRNHFNLFLFQPFNCFTLMKITNLVGRPFPDIYWLVFCSFNFLLPYILPIYQLSLWIFLSFFKLKFQVLSKVLHLLFYFKRYLSLFSGVFGFVCCGRLGVANRRENLYFYNFHNGHRPSNMINVVLQFDK